MASGIGERALVLNSVPVSSFPSCQLACELGQGWFRDLFHPDDPSMWPDF